MTLPAYNKKKHYNSMVSDKFKYHSFSLIKEFIDYMSPPPESGKNKFFCVESVEPFPIWVWGRDAEELVNRFDRFLNLKVYI